MTIAATYLGSSLSVNRCKPQQADNRCASEPAAGHLLPFLPFPAQWLKEGRIKLCPSPPVHHRNNPRAGIVLAKIAGPWLWLNKGRDVVRTPLYNTTKAQPIPLSRSVQPLTCRPRQGHNQAYTPRTRGTKQCMVLRLATCAFTCVFRCLSWIIPGVPHELPAGLCSCPKYIPSDYNFFKRQQYLRLNRN